MSTQTVTKQPTKAANQPQPQQGAIAKAAPTDTVALYDAVDRIDAVAEKYREEIDQPLMKDFRRAVVTALAIRGIREAMMAPQVTELLRSLMNTPLGFLTDRGPHAYRDDYKTPYDDETIRTAALEATIQGCLWTGNQFNIISGRCYITKEGYYHKLARLAGLTDLNVVPSVPVIREGSTVVRVAATWKMEGLPASLTDHEGKPGRNFPIVVNKMMGPDAIIGKAFRKAYKAIWDKIHGCESSQPDDDDAPQDLPRSGTSELKGRLLAGSNGTAGTGEQTGTTQTVETVKEGPADSGSGGGIADPRIDPNDNGIDEPSRGLFAGGTGRSADDPSRL